MRNSKIVSALVAVVMVVSTMLAFTATTVTANGAASSAAAAKPAHDLKIIDAGEIKNTGRFFVKGKVSTYPKKKVTLQRKVGNGAYKAYKKQKTNNKGKFDFQFDGPTGSCFKVVVPKTVNYKTTKMKIGCIVRA